MPRRGQNDVVAKSIIDNPTYREARKMVEETIVGQLKDLDLNEREVEHELVLLLRAGEQHHRMMEGYIMSGEISDINAQRRKSVV